MKILFISRLFYPHIGGVEKHVMELSKLLVKRGHVITILTEKYDKHLPESEKINGIKIQRIDVGRDDWFKKFRVWRNIWNNRSLMKESEIIHIHDVFFWLLPFKLFFLTKKTFMTFHGYEGNRIPGFKSKLSHKIAEKLTDGNICVGDFLKKWYGTKPDHVIYGGVDMPKNIKQKKIGNVIKFLFLGRLEEETGILEYLKALVLLKNQPFRFELTVLGDGSLMEKASKLASDSKIHVKFEGFQENIDKYLAKCDFVLTSRYLGILEALSFGKLVFAVYNNEIKKNYLQVSPFADFISISKNSDEIENQLIKYISDEKLKALKISKGYAFVKNQTWDKMVNTYLKLWKF